MRLIDADALLKKLNEEGIPYNANINYFVTNAPTINAVPKQHLVNWAHITRCKDCIYWQDNNGGYPVDDCKWNKDETPDPEDYCSWGDRKQDKEGE